MDSGHRNQPRAAPKRILIVEDEPIIRQVVLKTLEQAGFNTRYAVNGQEAIPKLIEENYDLILLDLRTPVMNGQELFAYITDNHPNLKHKVIFTSGDVMSQDTRAFLKESGRPFLDKPFRPEELLSIINDTLRLAEDE